MNQAPLLTPRDDERMDHINQQLRLICKKNGLTFGTDAYLLAAFTRPMPHGKAMDLGSGTGVIPLLLLSKNKAASVVAAEIQPAFAELIGRNAALNGFSDRLIPLLSDVRELTPSVVGGEMDLILSNPPYMKTDSGKRNLHDEKYIARHEVCGSIFDFCAAAGRLLRHGGRFVTVWRPDRLSDLMDGLRKANLEPKRMTFVHADTESEPCAVLTEAVKGAAPSLRISPPLILYTPKKEGETKRNMTPETEQVYETCRLGY